MAKMLVDTRLAQALGWVAGFYLLLTGCAGGPVPVELTSLRQDPGDEALVDDAFEILGLPWERSTAAKGTIKVHLVDEPDDPDFGGITLLVTPRCYKALVSFRSPEHIAHEVFHALVSNGDHVCEYPDCPDELLDNLMISGEAPMIGRDLTESQRDELEQGYRRLTRCR